MSLHLHSEYVAGCFRCELGRDEVDNCPPEGMPRPDLTDDPLGRECIAVRDRIRAQFRAARSVVALWEPRPL